MKTSALITATVALTVMLGACSAAPTGPSPIDDTPSFDFTSVTTTTRGIISVDTAGVMQSDSTTTCRTAVSDTSSYQIVASGTYAVAYSEPSTPTTTCTADR